MAGNFVYVDRGTCTFDTKADFAEAAGATGIIVGNNARRRADPDARFGRHPRTHDHPGQGCSDQGRAGVNATMRSIGTDPVDNSYRWLSGESDPAFGGAIRDMWTPTCYGDPGKVTDAEYHCSVDDSGGVHTNSGVVNHTFALMVDGGTYNTVTVPAIGLDKAANLFWQAQDAHLGPISDFTVWPTAWRPRARADGGGHQPDGRHPQRRPDTGRGYHAGRLRGGDSGHRGDGAGTEPAQCGFQPLLQQGAPAVTCGAGTTLKNVFTEDFEDGRPVGRPRPRSSTPVAAVPRGWPTPTRRATHRWDGSRGG